MAKAVLKERVTDDPGQACNSAGGNGRERTVQRVPWARVNGGRKNTRESRVFRDIGHWKLAVVISPILKPDSPGYTGRSLHTRRIARATE